MTENTPEIKLIGVAASPGIVIGPVRILAGELCETPRTSIVPERMTDEINKLRKALSESVSELEHFYRKTAAAYGEQAAQIFQVHQSILTDPMVIGECEELIRTEYLAADFAFTEVMDKYIDRLAQMADEIFRSRHADIRDLKRRVVRHVQGKAAKPLRFERPSIVFARELTPSDTMRLERDLVLGFAMDFGARTSHATILARSIRVPAVVGLSHAGEALRDDDTVILDGEEGVLIVNPSPETISEYQKRRRDYLRVVEKLEKIRTLPARTLDGRDVELACNIEFADEVDSIQDLSDGVGLYRTEYLYLTRDDLPTEEEQIDEYKKILLKLNGKPLIVRTFDLGGDKPPRFLQLAKEQNPFLGIRGVRLYFNGAHNLFRTQLRAILRAGVFGDVRIMLPMITCVSEISMCRRVVEEIKAELQRDGLKFAEQVPLGAMIEVPSAAATADIIARECEFLSIGTNDLIQYTVAVDRGNKNLNYLYQPYHPAVLRLIADTIQKGHEQGVWVGMCGEMAGDPLMTMVLIGMGLDEFSVSPVSLLHIKEIIRGVHVSECELFTRRVLSLSSVEEIQDFLKQTFQQKFGQQA